MRISRRAVSLALAVLGTAALPACGSGGGGGGANQNQGVGTITLTSITPTPIQGCGPTPFTINGTNFETVTGTTARVTFRAILPAGIQPFLGGTTDRATVIANVTSDTTITGLTPPIVICGVPAVIVEIDVTLESGVTATSTGIFTMTFNAPSIISINPNPIPAALPTPFTITGTGFGPVGGPVIVRFTGDNGALLWDDGTKNYANVVGTVATSTTITGITPIATVCDALQTGASIQLFFPDGCCTLPTAPGFVNFIAPTITSVSLNPVPAAVQQAGWQITGTNFGPAGTQATVRFIADNNFPLFNDGTSQTKDIPALVGGAGPVQTLTLTTPLAAVCGVASRASALRIISPFGSSCVQSAAGFVTFNAPTIVGAQAPIPGAIATAIVINGTNFGPPGSPLIVRFIANGGASIFDDGTSATEDVPGVVGGTVNTVNVTTPLVTACTTPVLATVRVFAPAGGACADSPPAYLTFNPPAITTFTPAASNAYPVAPNTTFTITSATPTYGPVGSPVDVRFFSAGGENIFDNGSKSETSANGTVASSTTITGVLPTASICGVASVQVNVRITLQNGSCQQTGAPVLTYNAPTITQINSLAPPQNVPSSNPAPITIGGTGFAPLNGIVQVFFVSDPAGPPLFGDGTQRVSPPQPGVVNGAGTLITVTPPHATVSPGVASRTASVLVTLPNGACAASVANFITYTAPTLTAFAPTGGTLFSAVTTGFTLTGANFGPTGSEASVRFTANTGTPFGNGTQNSFEVPAIVTNSGLITGNAAPLAALCGNPAVTTLAGTARVIFQDGSQSSNTAAFTYTAPTITTFTAPGFGPVPVPFTATGTGFAPVGTIAQVTFTAQGGVAPFADGTLNEVTVTGTVSAANTVTGLTPVATICGVAGPIAIDVRIAFYGGSCASTTGALSLTPPTILVGGVSPATVPSTVSTQVTITGTGFGPAGSLVGVTFSIPGLPGGAPGSTPFGNGSVGEITVTGVVTVANTTITVFTPLAAACTANVLSDVRVTLPNGSCTALAAGAITFVAPAITSNNLVPPNNSLTPGNPNPYTITGPGGVNAYAPVGAQVLIRYTATQPIFGDGTSTQIDVSGSVVNATTITTSLPLARVCVNTTAQIRIIFPMGACVDSAAGFITWTAPTLTTVAPNNAPALNPGNVTFSGANWPPIGTGVAIHWSSGTPVFAGGTSNTFDQFTNITVANQVTVIPPVASVCATTAATATLEFGNTNGTATCFLSTAFTYNAPTATLGAPTSVDALNPTAATITGTGLQPNANVTVRYTAATPIFAGGTQTAYEVAAVVNGTGTGLTTTVASPSATICGAASVNATVSLVMSPANCSVTAGTLTYNAPTVASVNIPTIQANAIPFGENATTTGAGGVPANTPVIVRLVAATQAIFNGGQATTIEVPGVASGNTTSFVAPAGTLCGVLTMGVTVQIVYPNGTCTAAANLITYNASQIAAAPGGFTPQNIPFAGAPFTITALNANPNQFQTPVGNPNPTVNVRFSVAAGTPFQGGTSNFAVVPGIVQNSTTITGIAPAVVEATNAIATVNVRVEFEDGSCTNNVTTSYLRTNNLAAVAGGGNAYFINATTTTLTSTVAVAGATGIDFAPAQSRAYVSTGATGTVRIVDMNGGTTPGTGTPTLLASPSIAIAGNLQGLVVDEKYNRVWVVNTGTSTASVIDIGTNQVVRTFALGFPAGVAPTGRIYWDSVNDRILVPGVNPAQGAADQITLFDATLVGLVGTPIAVADLGNGVTATASLGWTGGLAVDPVANLVFLTYNDADAADIDAYQVRDLTDPNLIYNTTGLAAATNPTAAMLASPNTGRWFLYAAGPAQLQAFSNTNGPVAVGAVLASAAVNDLALNASLTRGFIVLAGGTTQAFDTSTNVNVGAAQATAGGTFGAATSP